MTDRDPLNVELDDWRELGRIIDLTAEEYLTDMSRAVAAFAGERTPQRAMFLLGLLTGRLHRHEHGDE